MMLLQRYFTLGMVWATYASVSSTTVKDVNALKVKLLDGYNRNTNPDQDNTVNVTVGVLINAIGDLDERSEKLSAEIFLLTAWFDQSMTWNATETGIDTITMDPSEVWVPEMFVHNKHHDISIGALLRNNMPIVYFSFGRAIFNQYITTESTCDLDTSNFPFDRHTCSVEFHVNKWGVTVQPDFQDFVLSEFEPDGSWDVTNATINEENNGMVLHIQFERKPTFILLNLILPITLLALLSPMVFLLPNQSGERVGFSVTVLLATSVYMTVISDYVPQKSDPMPLISTMLFISYSLTTFVIIVVIINSRIYKRSDNIPVPRCLSCLVRVAKCLCFCFGRSRNIGRETYDEENESHSVADEQPKKENMKRQVSWKDVSWSIDVLFMGLIYLLKVMLLIVFLVVLNIRISESDKPHLHNAH